jgi:large conductance mechanosensitive channel
VEMLQEFKKFAMRGSVVDLAIGVIIGAAFGKIIDSMVNDIMMPIIGRIFGGLDSATTSSGSPLRRARPRPTTPPRRRAPRWAMASSSPLR